MIAILDYGIGNLFSVKKAFECIGYDAEVTSTPEQIKSASTIVLPGVGAYGAAMEELRQKELFLLIKEQIKESKPTLGIWLGVQLLFERSMEHFMGACESRRWQRNE
jgi:glutamine amidotransferase